MNRNIFVGDKKICDGNLAANSTIYGGALGLAARQQKFVMPMEAPYTGLLSGMNFSPISILIILMTN